MWSSNLGNSNAYTVVEFALVLLIVSLLVATVAPGVNRLLDEAKAESSVGEIEGIALEIDKYFDDNGSYPDSLEDVFSPVPLDPWGNPYEYLKIEGGSAMGKLRKDKNLVPINSDYDLYSKGPDGKSASALTANISQDDIVRGRDGDFFGEASEY